MVGDDRFVLQTVVSGKEKLVKIREELASSQQNSTTDNDAGEKLAYERLQILSSDAAEAKATKILAGLARR